MDNGEMKRAAQPMAPENVGSRLLTRTSYLCGALFFCFVGMLAAPSPGRALNAEVLSPELAPILTVDPLPPRDHVRQFERADPGLKR